MVGVSCKGNKENMMAKLEKLMAELKQVQDEIEDSRNRSQKLRAEIDELQEEENLKSGNYTNIEWLVNNPNTVGQYNAMKKYIKDNFGGEYNGITTEGYNTVSGQVAFGFMVDDYDGVVKPEYRKNIHKFVNLVLPHLKPVDGTIDFNYKVGEYSGIHNICYTPNTKVWSTSTTQYCRTTGVVEHESLDKAISYAETKAGQIND